MKAAIHTLGCKVNIYESEYIINILKENGYQIVDFDSKADIYIINTCTVTNTSDKKSEKMIKRARKQNKDAIIIAMGCHAQIKGDNIDADRLSVYVFHNGVYSSHGLPFFKASCISFIFLFM